MPELPRVPSRWIPERTPRVDENQRGSVATLYQVGRRSRSEMMALGKAMREDAPRSSHGDWQPAPRRPDPVRQLRAQEKGRVPELVPVRYARMAVSPFTFLRATAAIMANDLSHTPTIGVHVQACGDAHMLNFGVYGSPERRLVFDINDFDETTPGPWEWDLKRLATSLVVGCRDQGLGADVADEVVHNAVLHYRQRLHKLTDATTLEIRNSHLTVEDMLAELWETEPAESARRASKRISKAATKARNRTSLQVLSKLTQEVGGRLQFVHSPPLISRLSDAEVETMHAFFKAYLDTLQGNRRLVLEQYEFVDAAVKVVGVGSVGLRAYVALLQGRGDPDPLFLQMKQATDSVFAPYVGRSAYRHMGHRVVSGQRIMQAVSDPFLGWSRLSRVPVYVRQLRDMKGQAQVHPLADFFLHYGQICASSLARAHARSVDPAVIAGYIGSSDRFDAEVARFSHSYADQNERDYEVFMKAVRDGKLAIAEL